MAKFLAPKYVFLGVGAILIELSLIKVFESVLQTQIDAFGKSKLQILLFNQ